MDNLKIFNTLIENINKTSENIMRTSLPIMNKMANDKSFLFDKIKTKYPSMEEKEIKLKMKEISEGLLKDSQIIKKEFSSFIDHFINNTLSDEESKNLFLVQVWCGDTYGEGGIGGLKLLLEDLNEQLKNCNIDYIISNL